MKKKRKKKLAKLNMNHLTHEICQFQESPIMDNDMYSNSEFIYGGKSEFKKKINGSLFHI